jgi:hypothetical protein
VRLCRLGDQIAAVNGVSLLNVTHADAVRTLKESDHNIELVSCLFIMGSAYTCSYVTIVFMLCVFSPRKSVVRMTGSGHQYQIMVPWIGSTSVSFMVAGFMDSVDVGYYICLSEC